MKKNILNCEKSLLKPPPKDLATQKLTYAIFPPRADGKDKNTYIEEKKPLQNKRKQYKREAFMLCGLAKYMNEALTYYKQQACGKHGNFDQNYTVYDDPSSY